MYVALLPRVWYAEMIKRLTFSDKHVNDSRTKKLFLSGEFKKQEWNSFWITTSRKFEFFVFGSVFMLLLFSDVECFFLPTFFNPTIYQLNLDWLLLAWINRLLTCCLPTNLLRVSSNNLVIISGDEAKGDDHDENLVASSIIYQSTPVAAVDVESALFVSTSSIMYQSLHYLGIPTNEGVRFTREESDFNSIFCIRLSE